MQENTINNSIIKEKAKDAEKKKDNEPKLKYYFIINNPLEGAQSHDYMETNLSKIYLELHFLGRDKDVVAFKLLLEDYVKLDPYYYFFSKVSQLDTEDEKELLEKERKKYQQEKEIIELNVSISDIEIKSKIEMKENFVKFYLLNRTKVEKKFELQHEYDEKKKEMDMLNSL